MKRKQGFTLLEMLVVLLIVSLLTTLLMQSFAYILQLRTRFLVQLSDLQQGALQEHWFRSSTTALIADYPDVPQARVFKGESRQFSGLTLAALDAEAGVPTPCAWKLTAQDGYTILQYQTVGGKEWKVAYWLGEMGEFQYLDSKGKWFSEWPPKTLGIVPTQLPKAILLTGLKRDIPFTWIVQLTGRDIPRIDFRLNEL